MPSYAMWLGRATAALQSSDSPRLDAEILLCHALGVTRTQLYAWPEREIPAGKAGALDALLARRCSGESVSYITGSKEFWSQTYNVQPGVLVPRPETELLVELVLDYCRQHPHQRIVDAGTGSGAIGIALAHELTQCSIDTHSVVATDISNIALQVAAGNARHILRCESVRFVRADWLACFASNSFSVIVSNPPYLATDDAHLNTPELQHEPQLALASGHDGLQAITQIVKEALVVGTPGCRVLIEHGNQQGLAVRKLMQSSAYTEITTHADLAGHDRVTSGYSPTRQD